MVLLPPSQTPQVFHLFSPGTLHLQRTTPEVYSGDIVPSPPRIPWYTRQRHRIPKPILRTRTHGTRDQSPLRMPTEPTDILLPPFPRQLQLVRGQKFRWGMFLVLKSKGMGEVAGRQKGGREAENDGWVWPAGGLPCIYEWLSTWFCMLDLLTGREGGTDRQIYVHYLRYVYNM